MSNQNAEYERLTTVDHTGKRQTLMLQILHEDARWIRGLKVNAEGEDTESRYEDGTLIVVERLIDKGAIHKRTPLVMNNHYGMLEAAQNDRSGAES